MSRILFASLLLLAALPATALADVEWGSVPREELFAPHFPEWPNAEAVVLFHQGIARVDSKDRLKFRHHKRVKIFKASGADRGIVRIPYHEGDEIKDFRAHTIVPPGNIVEVKGDHRREEKHGKLRTLVVEFPSVQPGAVIEYEYELRRNDIHSIPAWVFRERDPVKVSRFEFQIPDGMSYDARFAWTPSVPPAPQEKRITNPDDTRFEIRQIRWELTNLEPVEAIAFADEPFRWDMKLYPQLTKFASTYKNVDIARPWSAVAAEAADSHARFLKDQGGVKAWAGDVSGDPSAVAQALFAKVRDGIRTDENGARLEGSTAAAAVRDGRATGAAKNVLLASLLNENGIAADVVRIRPAGLGPAPEKYRVLDPYSHAVVRATVGGETVWLDASVPGCPFAVLPPNAHVAQGLLVKGDGGEHVNVSVPDLPARRAVATAARVDSNGVLQAASNVRFEGWEALRARAEALGAGDGGRAMAEELVTSRFGRDATVDSFRYEALDDPSQPLDLSVKYSVPGYADGDGSSYTFPAPFLTGLRENPVPAGERFVPIRFGFRSEVQETLELAPVEGWAVRGAPAAGRARTGDVTFSARHQLDAARMSSTRSLELREPELIPDAAAELRGTFDKIVTADASEVTLARAPRTSSTR